MLNKEVCRECLNKTMQAMQASARGGRYTPWYGYDDDNWVGGRVRCPRSNGNISIKHVPEGCPEAFRHVVAAGMTNDG